MSREPPRRGPLAGGAPPAAVTLNRRLVLLVAGGAALVLAVATAVALQSPPQRGAGDDRPPRPADAPLPKALAELPGSYGEPERIAQYLPAGAAPGPDADTVARLGQLEAQSAALQKQLEDALAQVAKLQEEAQRPPPAPPPPAAAAPAQDDGAAAAASGLFFNGGTPAGLGGVPRPGGRPGGPLLADPAAGPGAGPGDGFLQGEGAPPVRAAAAGGVQRIAPLSIAAGTIIPASLITGINSDIPGSLVAQVRENVYDTLTGTRLLVPQGSRLVGAYGSDVIYGQERVRAGFNRLIRPDGTWIALESVEASDTAGMAGLADDVNNHWGKLIVGAVISATFSLGVTASQGTPGGFYPSPAQAAAANAAGSIGQTGAMFAQRQLDQKPTITIRPGFSFDIIVTRDILLPVYDEAGAGAGLAIPAAGGSQP